MLRQQNSIGQSVNTIDEMVRFSCDRSPCPQPSLCNKSLGYTADVTADQHSSYN